GLGAADLWSAPVASSSLRLLGLVRHLSDVEYWWFGHVLHGARDLPFYGTEEDSRFDFAGAAGADPREAFERYRAAVAFAREVAAGYPLDHVVTGADGEPVTARWIHLHMLEEYARHNGHADLLREAVDGVTGE
ncbi:MAG TPA: DinB family protein, partial [Phytomonospora sp.]